ncbi:MAG: hypothetical protein PHI68_07135 [Candidatus Cloacimonetes bacterium]|nr:hypothetical protein [Candidatus Cloacimonadota bacterium]
MPSYPQDTLLEYRSGRCYTSTNKNLTSSEMNNFLDRDSLLKNSYSLSGVHGAISRGGTSE